MRNELRNAYLLVLEDLMENGSSILQGRYDAEHGNRIYMYGVQYVMETIAYNVDEKIGDKFVELFIRSVCASEERAFTKEVDDERSYQERRCDKRNIQMLRIDGKREDKGKEST